MHRFGKPASTVLTTLRRFPTLEPVSILPVSAKILDLPTRRDILWQAVVYERDADRVGSKVILGRNDMGYSNKKLLPQKGSGKARQGDRGNPIRHDGGRAHARSAPGDMSTEIPHKVYSLAVLTSLSMKYRDGHLYIVDGAIDFPLGHTLIGREFLKNHVTKKLSTTFITLNHRPNLFDAFAEFDNVDIVPADVVQVRDLLKPRRLIIEKDALAALIDRYDCT